MAKKILIGLASLFILLVLVFGGTLIYVKQKYPPEKLKKLAIESIEENIPNSKVMLGEVDFSLGKGISLNMKDLKLNLKNKGDFHSSDLFSLKLIKISIPITNLFSGKGEIKAILKSPKVFYQESIKSNNWKVALESPRGEAKKVDTPPRSDTGNKKLTVSKKEKSEDTLPGFILGAIFKAEVENLDVNYALKDKKKGNVRVQSIEFGPVSLIRDSVFSLNSLINLNLNKKECVTFRLLLNGKLNLPKYLSSQELVTNLNLKINKLKHPLLKNEIDFLNSKIQVHLASTGELRTKIQSKVLTDSSLGLNVFIKKEGIQVKDLQGELNLRRITEILKEFPKEVTFNDSKLKFKGLVDLKKEKIFPQIEFEVGPRIDLKTVEEPFQFRGNGKIRPMKTSINFNLKGLGGLVLGSYFQGLNINKIPKKLENFPPFNLAIVANGFKFSKEYLQSVIYKERPKAVPTPKTDTKTPSVATLKEKESQPTMAKKFPILPLPPGKISLKWKKVFFGKEEFKGNGAIIIGKKKVTTKSLNLYYSKGVGKITHSSILGVEKIDNLFTVNLSNFNLKGLQPFLPKSIRESNGQFSGSIKGKVKLFSKGKPPQFDIFTNLNAKGGELKGIKISEAINEAIKSFPYPKDKKKLEKYTVNGKFDEFSLIGNFSQNLYNLKKIMFRGPKKRVLLILKEEGKIYPLDLNKAGILDFDLRDQSKGSLYQKLKEKAGTESIPLRLLGKGVRLKPDINYTLGILAKMAAKKAAKDQLKKQKDKLLKKLLSGKNKKKVLDKITKNNSVKKISNDKKKRRIEEKVKGLFDSKKTKNLFKNIFGN